MKRLLLTFLALFVLSSAMGQNTEFRISLNSGLFSFVGLSAKESSFINYDDQSKKGATNNFFGSKSGLSYGLSLNIKRISTRKFIMGLDVGYEVLRNKISINQINGYAGTSTYQVAATGQTTLNYNCLNLNPFFGYRIARKKINFDLTAGFDVSHIFKANEKGNATDANGIIYNTSLDRMTIKNDVRPRFQISADYGRYGIYLGYSFGLLNYMSGYVGGTNEAVSRFMRFGFSYTVK